MTKLSTLLEARAKKRYKCFLTESFIAFAAFIFGSYSLIIWLSFTLLSHNALLHQNSFNISSYIFQRVFGFCNFCAFLSFWIQSNGLISSTGILPIKYQLAHLTKLSQHQQIPSITKYYFKPTIFWLTSSDFLLHFICFVGTICSFSLMILIYDWNINWLSPTLWFITTICYFNLKLVSAEFLQLQMDSMLIETNICCVFLSINISNPIGIILIYWLHYRVMFCAGIVKLTSGCPQWRHGTAMRYHYWTQPIPSASSYYIWKLGFYKFSTYLSIVSEIFLPFLVLIPYRIPRLISGINTIGLMFMIFISGNFGFLNISTAAFAILCIDDGIWKYFGFNYDYSDDNAYFLQYLRNSNDTYSFTIAITSFVWLCLILFVSFRVLWRMSKRELPYICCVKEFCVRLSMWSIVNSYGKFAVMTTFRHELIFEGTIDNIEWKRYEFKYKPSDVNYRPRFALCHLPRLDWRLWFLPLRTFDENKDKWLLRFIYCLLQNEERVLGLLRYNPFNNQINEPIYAVRVLQYEYRFPNDEQNDEFGTFAMEYTNDRLRWEVGKWWSRRNLYELYLPVQYTEDVLLSCNQSNKDKHERTKLIQCTDDKKEELIKQ
eukprot:489794_1